MSRIDYKALIMAFMTQTLLLSDMQNQHWVGTVATVIFCTINIIGGTYLLYKSWST